jgi:uncharacterized protein YqeY
MTLIKRLHEDFIIAMKAKDPVAKAAITSIKAKITEAEKSTSGFSGSDEDVIKIISKAIKQREESSKIYSDAGKVDLATVEKAEAQVLEVYMPSQMTDAEIETALNKIVKELSPNAPNQQALIGKSIGEFNKRYNGRADIQKVKVLIAKVTSL